MRRTIYIIMCNGIEKINLINKSKKKMNFDNIFDENNSVILKITTLIELNRSLAIVQQQN